VDGWLRTVPQSLVGVRVRLYPDPGGSSMSIVVRFNPTGKPVTADKYDEAVRRHGEKGIELPPDGMEYHVCFGSAESIRVSEIWDSREQWEAYGERLMPLLAEVGIEPGEPEVFEVHNIIRR
jgi:hypothetical protein